MSTMAAALSRCDWLGIGAGGLRLPSPRVNLWVGTIVVLVLAMVGLLAPWIAPYDFNYIDWDATLKGPSSSHPFGTDDFGRDLLSRVIYGARIDLLVGFLCAICPLVIGIGIGTLPVAWSRWVDRVVRLDADADVLLPLVVVPAIFVWGPSLIVFVAVLSLVGWMPYARLTRMPALKAPKRRVAACLVFALSDMLLAMLLHMALSFLGLGVPPPAGGLGVMLLEGWTASTWWPATFPLLAILFVVFGLSMFADGLAARFGLRQR